MEELKTAAEAREKAAEEQMAVAVLMKRAAEEAREAAEAKMLQFQTQVEELKSAAARREEAWPAEKKRITLMLAASNKRAQSALAEEFPEVAGKFDIKEKGMEPLLTR